MNVRHWATFRSPTAAPVNSSFMSAHPSAGFTLLEVIIASAILIFGIVAMVKIFPAGLGVIQQNENATVAARLAEDVLERFSRAKDELPDAIVAINSDGTFNAAIDPQSTTDDGTINSIDSVKRIVGEPHRVLSNGSIMVNFPPIAALDNSTDPELQNPRVYQERTLTETSSSPAADQFQPVSSGGKLTGDLTFNANEAGHYVLVSYKWIDTDNAINHRTYHVERERHQVPTASPFQVTLSAANSSIPKPGISPASFDRLVPGSITVVEQQPVTMAAMSEDQRERGVIPLSDVSVNTGDTVKVDYTVEDWRWITETRTVSSNKVIDLVFEDVSDVLVTDLKTAPGGPIYPNASASNYLKGIIAFSDIPNEPVRVTYKTGEEWFVQLWKAPVTFTDVVTADTETYRQFADRFWQSPNSRDLDGDGVADSNRYLGFRQINAGQTVVLDYVADNPGGNPTPTVDSDDRTVIGEMHTISPDAAASPVYTGFSYEVRLHNNYREIISVRGVSAKARVGWVDRGRIRLVEVPTYLARR